MQYRRKKEFHSVLSSEDRQKFDEALKNRAYLFNLTNIEKFPIEKPFQSVLHTVGMKRIGFPDVIFMIGPLPSENVHTPDDTKHIAMQIALSFAKPEKLFNFIQEQHEMVTLGHTAMRRYVRFDPSEELELDIIKRTHLAQLTDYYGTMEYGVSVYRPHSWIS